MGRGELDDRGFAVATGVFTPDELAVVRADYESLRRSGSKGQELISDITFDDPRMQHLRARITSLLESVVGPSEVRRVLLPMRIGNYISSREVHYGLHCDYGILSPTRGGFKVWIPLVKPEASEDGMTFVRMDRFREREPTIARAVAGRGAAGIKDSGEVVVVGSSIERFRLAQPIDDLCETPAVRVGDAVLFRAQDTFHRSQVPGERPGAERVAWAFPVRIADEPILRDEVFASRKKREYVGRARAALALACFWYHRRNRITVAELDRFERRVAASEIVPSVLYGAAWVLEPRSWHGGAE